MRSCLQGSAVAAWTVGGVVRKEAGPVFTHRGVIGDDVSYAAQMAWFPFGQVVEEVACVLGEGRPESLLLPSDGEPLGPPVRMIAEALLPLLFVGGALLADEVGAQDLGGVRRA